MPRKKRRRRDEKDEKILRSDFITGNGMSITAFATEAGTATQAAGKITVEGLTKEDTTVKIYKVVSWNEAQSKWEAEAWAKDHVDLTKDPVDIDWDALKDVATDADL
jgi:hypothetical protein